MGDAPPVRGDTSLAWQTDGVGTLLGKALTAVTVAVAEEHQEAGGSQGPDARRLVCRTKE